MKNFYETVLILHGKTSLLLRVYEVYFIDFKLVSSSDLRDLLPINIK